MISWERAERVKGTCPEIALIESSEFSNGLAGYFAQLHVLRGVVTGRQMGRWSYLVFSFKHLDGRLACKELEYHHPKRPHIKRLLNAVQLGPVISVRWRRTCS